MFKFNITEITESNLYKKITKKVYGFGAAIVIIGALFKILHIPGGGPVLTLGMAIEAIIFIISAFEPVDEEIDWSLVYPELAGVEMDDGPAPHETMGRHIETWNNYQTFQNNNAHAPTTDTQQTAHIPPQTTKAASSRAEGIEEYQKMAQSTKVEMNNLQSASQKLSKLYEHQSKNIEQGQKYYDLIQDGTPGVDNLNQMVRVFSDEINKTLSDVTKVSESMDNFSDKYDTITQRMEDKSAELDAIDEHNKNVMDQYTKVQKELDGFKSSISTLNNYYSNMLAGTQKANKKS